MLKILKYIGEDANLFPYDRYIVLGDNEHDAAMLDVLLISPHEDNNGRGDPPVFREFGLVIQQTRILKDDPGYVEDHEWFSTTE